MCCWRGKGTVAGLLQTPAPPPAAEGDVHSVTKGSPSEQSWEIETVGDPERMGAGRGLHPTAQQAGFAATHSGLDIMAAGRPGAGLRGGLPGQCPAPHIVGAQLHLSFQKSYEISYNGIQKSA